ncbi:MAG: hypothetical protein ACOX4Y_01355 [Limnochordia bacterium]
MGRRHYFRAYYILAILLFILTVSILSGCGGRTTERTTEDEIYHYAGGGAPGDFYQLTANMTKNTIFF